MAALRFFHAYDLRDLPGGTPAHRTDRWTYSDGETLLRLGSDADAEAGYRPKVAPAYLPWGEVTQGQKKVVLLSELKVPALGLDKMSGADIARLLLSGDDRITGSAEDDRLLGFDGDDRIAGGKGADVMTGGKGADTFRFGALSESRPTSHDKITDFLAGRDVVDLSGIDAVHGKAGNQRFDFLGSDAFGGVAGELRVVKATLEADVNGDGIADFAIHFDKGVPGAHDLLL